MRAGGWKPVIREDPGQSCDCIAFCQSGAKIHALIANHFIYEWHDGGAVSGFVRCVAHSNAFLYRMVDWEPGGEPRVYGVASLGGVERAVLAREIPEGFGANPVPSAEARVLHPGSLVTGEAGPLRAIFDAQSSVEWIVGIYGGLLFEDARHIVCTPYHFASDVPARALVFPKAAWMLKKTALFDWMTYLDFWRPKLGANTVAARKVRRKTAWMRLQEWYVSECNGDWEHRQGVSIGTLDNPGWTVRIDLADTELEEESFEAVDIERAKDDWLILRVQEGKFEIMCGPLNLEEGLELFMIWAYAARDAQFRKWREQRETKNPL